GAVVRLDSPDHGERQRTELSARAFTAKPGAAPGFHRHESATGFRRRVRSRYRLLLERCHSNETKLHAHRLDRSRSLTGHSSRPRDRSSCSPHERGEVVYRVFALKRGPENKPEL